MWEAWPFSLKGRGYFVVYIGGCFLSLECMQFTMTKVSGHIGGKGPNHGRGQSGSKYLMYEDLNGPQSNNWSLLSNFVIRLGFEGLSLDLK